MIRTSSFPGRAVAALLALGLALALAAACGGDGGGSTPAAGRTPEAGQTPTAPAGETPPAGGGTTAEIKMVSGTAFDKSELRIAAGVDVEVTVDNTSGTHSFAVYEDEEATGDPLAQTDVCSSPCTEQLTLNLQAGEYFFRCTVHPTIMRGELIAE